MSSEWSEAERIKQESILKEAFGDVDAISTGYETRYLTESVQIGGYGETITTLLLRLFPDYLLNINGNPVLIEVKESKGIEALQYIMNLRREEMGVSIYYLIRQNGHIHISKPSDIKMEGRIMIGTKKITEMNSESWWRDILIHAGFPDTITLHSCNVGDDKSGDPHFYPINISVLPVIKGGRIIREEDFKP